MKKRIEEFRGRAKGQVASWKLKFKKLWNDPYDALLFRSLVVALVGVGSLLLAVVVGFFAMSGHHGSGGHGEVAEVAAHEAPKEEGGHGAESESESSAIPGLGVQHIPKSILAQRDGIPEEDKDLEEPPIESGRSFASITETPQVAPYNPYVTYTGILGSTAEKSANVGRVAMDVSFEVDSHLVKKELEVKEKEITSMISNLIGEQDYDLLRNEQGRLFLKRRIFDEVNFKLKNGKIKDVLYSEFIIR